MRRGYSWLMENELMTKIAVILLTGVLSAISLNMFLIPANVFSAGMNGVSQLVSGAFEMYLGAKVDTGVLIFILNIPIFIISWLKLGRSATIYSFLTVSSISIITLLVPQVVVTDNALMNAIVGGVLVGIGAGLCLKFGFTTGGLDVIALVIGKTTGKSVGSLMFAMNLLIIFIAGMMYNWESALFTIISIYCLTQVIDVIHTGSQKVTAMIISHQSELVVNELKANITRGMTLLPARGGYTNKESTMIIMVVSRYELFELEKSVYTIDPNAFINIMPTQNVMGMYWNEDQQKAFMQSQKEQLSK